MLGRILRWAVILLVALAAGDAVAQVRESRVALVIGNAAYINGEPLKNPVNDARAMARTLEQAGFEVILRENTSRRALTDALREFAGRIVPGGVGLFYYAGHGMQVRGANYLLPVDANLGSEFDLKYETLDVNDVLSRLDDARARLSLVILDACRDNPFVQRFRSTTRGLASVDAPRGSIIAYATAPGDTAADGNGANGVFTGELLAAMVIPGLKIEDVFKRTIDGVARATANRQTPWLSSSFRGEFYFTPPAAATAPAAAAPPPGGPSPEAIEHAAWGAISGSSNPQVFELFLRRFPNGIYADFARARLEELKTASAARPTPPDAGQLAAAQEAARRKAEEEKAAAEAKRKAEDEARLAASEAARRKAEEDKAAAEAKRKADDEARRVAAEVARRKAEEEKAAAEAKRKAEDEARRAAAEAARRKAEEEKAAAEAKRKADDEARRAAAEAARRKAEEEKAAKAQPADEEALRRVEAEKAEQALQLSEADRRQVQAALTIKGLDTGGTDGVFGPQTRQMIKAFQRARGQPATGFLDQVQYAALMRDTEVARARQEEEKRREEARRKAEEDARRTAAAAPPAAPISPSAAPAKPTAVAPPPAAVGGPVALTVVLNGAPNNMASCAPVIDYKVELHPDRLRIKFRGGWEDLRLAPDGSFSTIYNTPGHRLDVRGNARTRFMRVENLAGWGCNWLGSF